MRWGNRGLTLTELLVSTALIGIITLGVVAFSISMKGIQESTNKTTLLNMQVIAVMTNIKRDAFLAVGNQADPGILVEFSTPANNNWIAFRQDQNVPPTPADFSDDVWVIYIRDLTADTLRTCTKTSAPTSAASILDSSCSAANALELSSHIENVMFELITAGRFNVDIMVQVRFTPGTVVNPIDNPEYILSDQISPPGHNW
ncbi:hypothetical protein MNBD_UNCLBAC01-1574 [hydrothermal vent metagenome]|uniref:Prepilin-type N-terminal cleavage/methylation domain-containing protein n=1 Tax=hydrothermal vent metagenome TaxID=652676 RepID=A0A3B1DIP3_9ZZZZ